MGVVNPSNPSGKWVEIPGVAITIPLEQFLLDFSLLLLLWKSHFALRWEDVAGSELALVVSGGQAGSASRSSLAESRGFQSREFVFLLWKLDGAVPSAASAGGRAGKCKFRYFCLIVVSDELAGSRL